MSPHEQDRRLTEDILAALAVECPAFGSPLPLLSEVQLDQISQLGRLYREWNARINVISRKDMDAFYIRHVMHSLSIARIMRPKEGARILDVGTGGGFPGIPLAILFPHAEFTLCDSIGKKVKVVQAVTDSLGLGNVSAIWARAESLVDCPPFDFVVSRAVTRMPAFLEWVRPLTATAHRHEIPNGVFYLKGGDLEAELASVHEPIQEWRLDALLEDAWFESKLLLHVGL